MDDTESRITVLHAVNKNTNCKQIVDLIEGLVLVDHLLVNTEEMLYASDNRRLDRGFLHVVLNLIYNLLNKGFSRILAEINLLDEIKIHIRFQKTEGEIIELNLDLGNTETICNRSVDLKCLTRLFLLFFRLPVLSGSHIVQTVGKFYDDNTDVFRHCEEHLSQVLCLNLHLVFIP